MADNLSHFYTGGLTPPLRMPDGSYVPAQLQQPQMTPEQIYEGIYGEPLSSGPTTRQVKTIPVNPGGMGEDPVSVYSRSNYVAQPRFASASPTVQPLPGQPNGSIVAGKSQARLPQNAFGYGTNGASGGQTPALAAIDNLAPLDDPAAGMKPGFNKMVPAGMPVNSRSRDSLAYAQAGRNALANMPPITAGAQAGGVIDLTAVNPKNPQAMANSQGQAIQVGSKIYYPAGKAPKAAPAAGREPGPLGKLFGLQQGGLGGLLSGMFGGGQAQQAGGGGLGALLSGGSSFGSSPSQGMAMTVDPNTSTGSTLSGMGFSPGAAVPAATIRGLSERGYI